MRPFWVRFGPRLRGEGRDAEQKERARERRGEGGTALDAVAGTVDSLPCLFMFLSIRQLCRACRASRCLFRPTGLREDSGVLRAV